MWSFALLIHEVLVGVDDSDCPLPPFATFEDYEALAIAGRLVAKPLPSAFPAVFQTVCDACFQQQPESRPSAKQLSEMFASYLSRTWST